MEKEDKRKSILVNEACFSQFDSVRNQLNKNSSDTLSVLMQKEIVVKTETTVQQNQMNNRIEHLGDFDNCVKQLNKNNLEGDKIE